MRSPVPPALRGSTRTPGSPDWPPCARRIVRFGWRSSPTKTRRRAGESAYNIAIADSAAAGAHWIVTLDEGLAKGIATGNDEARKAWSSIAAALAFFENHRDWAAWEPSGSIGVLSSFSGKDEFLGTEVLNLAARRSLLYRVLDRSVPSSHKLAGLRAVLYVDNDPPSSELKARLEEFVRVGGLLILPQALASTFKGGLPASAQSPVTNYGRSATDHWPSPSANGRTPTSWPLMFIAW